MSITDAIQSTYAVCGLPTLALALFTTLMLWIVRPEHRSLKYAILYFVISLSVYFVVFTIDIWFSGTVIGNNMATFYE